MMLLTCSGGGGVMKMECLMKGRKEGKQRRCSACCSFSGLKIMVCVYIYDLRLRKRGDGGYNFKN